MLFSQSQPLITVPSVLHSRPFTPVFPSFHFKGYFSLSAAGLTVPLSRPINIYLTPRSSFPQPFPACSHIPGTLIPFLGIPHRPALRRNKSGHSLGCCGATGFAASRWLWLFVLGVGVCKQELRRARPAMRALNLAEKPAGRSPFQPPALDGR